MQFLLTMNMHKHILYYLSYYKPHKRQLSLSLFLALVQPISLLPITFIIKHLFDIVLSKNATKNLLNDFLYGVILILISTLITLINRSISLKLIKSIIYEIRDNLLQKTIFLNTAYYTNEDLDKAHTSIVYDTERIDNLTSALLTQLLPSGFILIFVSAILVYINFYLYILLCFSIPVLYLFSRLFGKKLKTSIKNYHEDFSQFSKGISFILKYSDLIKFSSSEKDELLKQKKILIKLKKSGTKVAAIMSEYNAIQGNIFLIITISVLLFGGIQVINGMTTLGSLISFYVLLNFISVNVKIMINVFPVIVEGAASIASLMPLLKNENNEQMGQKDVEFNDSISIDKVFFGFEDNMFLSNINFDIKKHQIVVINGKSGTGKSTLIKLILGVYNPLKGQILIDGVNIKELDMFKYRKRISLLSQEPLFFPGTIRQNLLYGIESISEEIIVEICKNCQIHDFIITLQHGYDSDMGNNGKKLSGGQKQRLAIARALIRDPEILILDEPDNNLDQETIIKIIENIKALKITTIVISHDPTILPNADQLIRL